MAKVLNFNTIKKNYLTVTLADDNKTTLMIGTPTKALLEELTNIQSTFDNMDEADPEVMDSLYMLCAKLMSRNKLNKKVDKDKLADCMDLEDVIIFFNAYMSFLEEIQDAKN